MENASKALIIAGAILLSILIIAIGIFIFNQANTTITSSLTGMSTQEKDAFNNEFTTYQGQQKGSNVKALLSKLASNLATYKDEMEKIPVVQLATKTDSATALSDDKRFQTINYVGVTEGATQPEDSVYTNQISKMRNKVLDKHTYWIDVRIGSNGIVLGIAIGDITNMNNTQIEEAKTYLATQLDEMDEKNQSTKNDTAIGF